jgi:D-3-phosphoglycerate dehydrogenase
LASALASGGNVTSSVDILVLDLLEWLGDGPRPYGEVLDAWGTSCPRLPVWEEANDRGFISRQRLPGGGPEVAVSARGAAYLTSRRPRTRGVATRT